MSEVAITTVAIGNWYPYGAMRMLRAFEEVSPGFEITAWVNCYPPGAPGHVLLNGFDYGGYCAKPWALKALMDKGAEVGILLDASYWPIKHIGPLIEKIGDSGYYLNADGFTVGQWASDAALKHFDVTRDDAMTWRGCLSGCVGIDFKQERNRKLVNDWAFSWHTFAGYHSNDKAHNGDMSYRNVGRVSEDPRCLGHRHDQTALGILSHQAGLEVMDEPRLAAYDGPNINPDAVLICRGR